MTFPRGSPAEERGAREPNQSHQGQVCDLVSLTPDGCAGASGATARAEAGLHELNAAFRPLGGATSPKSSPQDGRGGAQAAGAPTRTQLYFEAEAPAGGVDAEPLRD